MLGEASHGTSEFYTTRAEITKRLIAHHGFAFIAVEGDWPDCYRINAYVKGYKGAGEGALEVLQSFDRWPAWMWGNREMIDLVEWLRTFNTGLPPERRVGFYGLDLYSLWSSMKEVVSYLERTDHEAARQAKAAFSCFDPYHGDEHAYAYSTALVPENCQQGVLEVLRRLQEQTSTCPDAESTFNAEQNARAVAGAEAYYRAMMRGDRESWNVRDTHMLETLQALMSRDGNDAKGIVWAHNTHIGDARATDMAPAGMVNIGQLARERYGEEAVYLAGFSTYEGYVIAGREWEAPWEIMPVPKARPGSWDALMHEVTAGDQVYLLDTRADALAPVRNQRAIGVVYRARHDGMGNYVPTSLSDRYDAVIFIDRTQALKPLKASLPNVSEVPETYPAGY